MGHGVRPSTPYSAASFSSNIVLSTVIFTLFITTPTPFLISLCKKMFSASAADGVMQRNNPAAVAGMIWHLFAEKTLDTDRVCAAAKFYEARAVPPPILFVQSFDPFAGTGNDPAVFAMFRFSPLIQAARTGFFCEMTVADRTDHSTRRKHTHFRGR